MRHPRLGQWLVIAILLSVSAPASVHADSKMPYAAPAYSHHGINITPREIFQKGKKIWLDLYVQNATGKIVTLDKNVVSAKLPDGRTVSRAMGTFGKYAKPNQLAPGESHPFSVEFEVGPAPTDLALVWGNAILINGQAVSLPDFAIHPGN